MLRELAAEKARSYTRGARKKYRNERKKGRMDRGVRKDEVEDGENMQCKTVKKS